jgi:hypothetical protein
VRTGTLLACIKGFLEGIPAFFSERKKHIKVRPETVRAFIARVDAEKLVGK